MKSELLGTVTFGITILIKIEALEHFKHKLVVDFVNRFCVIDSSLNILWVLTIPAYGSGTGLGPGHARMS